MSSANPVETKVETAAKVGGVVDAAAALAGPTPPVAEAATKTGLWAFRNPKRFGMVAGSTALALAAGTIGWKYFSPPSKAANAQDDKTVLAQGKPEEPTKPVPAPIKNDEVSPLMLELPSVPAPRPTPPPSPMPERVELELPVIAAPKPTPRPAETESPLVLPPAPRPAAGPRGVVH